MKFFISFLISFFFSACSDNTTSSQVIDDNNSNPLFSQQWSINYNAEFYRLNSVDENAHINPQNTFETYTGSGVKVAVIDDGFDVNHPEIKGKIIATISVDENGVVGSDVSHLDTRLHHGTSVAGIIAAANNDIGLVGVSPDIELILIRYPTNNYLDDIIFMQLFTLAVDAGAEIINCSWGTGDVSDAVRDFMENLDAVVVFASGNGNTNMGNDESAMPSVIGVGATDRTNLRTRYSDYGKDLDIVAPGGDSIGITTLDTLGIDGASEDEYLRFNEFRSGSEVSFIGTSAAAPIISGVIALGIEKNPNLTRQEIQELLKISTSHIGMNIPYIDDMISSSSLSPIITGLYGTNQDVIMKVRLTSMDTNVTFGFYSVESIGNNEWSASVSDILDEGNYKIELLSDSNQVLATDEDFTIDTLSSSQTDKRKRKNNYYGYGKIDLDKFISNVN